MINLPAGFNAPADPPSPLSAERLASCIEPNFPACSIKIKEEKINKII